MHCKNTKKTNIFWIFKRKNKKKLHVFLMRDSPPTRRAASGFRVGF